MEKVRCLVTCKHRPTNELHVYVTGHACRGLNVRTFNSTLVQAHMRTHIIMYPRPPCSYVRSLHITLHTCTSHAHHHPLRTDQTPMFSAPLPPCIHHSTHVASPPSRTLCLSHALIIPHMHSSSLTCTHHPSHALIIPHMHSSSLTCTHHPSHTLIIPHMHSSSLTCTHYPSHALIIPHVHSSSLTCTHHPSHAFIISHMHSSSLTYTHHPSHALIISHMHSSSLTCTHHPSHALIIPHMHSSSLTPTMHTPTDTPLVIKHS